MSSINELSFTDLYLFKDDPMIKIDGFLEPLGDRYAGETRELRERVLKRQADTNNEEFSIVHNEQRYRVAVYECVSGYEATLRKIGSDVVDWNKLGFPKYYLPMLLHKTLQSEREVVARGGIILIGGKPDSGKSTTSYALIDQIMRHSPWFGVTIEDPVEMLLPTRYENGATIRQREIKSSNFDDALRIALRSNCDLIFVGEIRTPEGAQLALQAAQTGHLVITTIHASDLTGSIDRFLSVVGKTDQNQSMFSNVFRGALWQSLEKSSGLANRTMNCKALFTDPEVRRRIKNGELERLTSALETQQAKIENGRGLEAS